MSERRTSFSYEDLIACGRGELFGEGNAQLPLPPMLMFDRISEISETGGANGKGGVRAEFDIKPDLWFFSCHFKGDPVMPGCLGLDALWQLTGFFLGWLGLPGRGRALGVGEVKVRRSGAPDDKKGRLWRGHEACLQGQADPWRRRRVARGRRQTNIRGPEYARRLVQSFDRDPGLTFAGAMGRARE